MSVAKWWIYHGTGTQHEWTLPEAPPWRRFDGTAPDAPADGGALPEWAGRARPTSAERRRTMAEAYRADPDEVRLVNAAIYLRRPLLVTGPPGSGKSTLAYSIAHELALGNVLRWPISSRTTLKDGLYRYDAIGRLHEVTLSERGKVRNRPTGIGRYLGLGPLGTALLPTGRPRVLLIDELDKGDVDLPNDLLSVFEDGEFTIPELQREVAPVVTVLGEDGQPAYVEHGTVRCAEFPIIIITTNGERDFPAAFTRRCIRLNIDTPAKEKLKRIVEAHLGAGALQESGAAELFEDFVEKLKQPDTILATDQLLNVLRMDDSVDPDGDSGWRNVLEYLLQPLNRQP